MYQTGSLFSQDEIRCVTIMTLLLGTSINVTIQATILYQNYLPMKFIAEMGPANSGPRTCVPVQKVWNLRLEITGQTLT